MTPDTDVRGLLQRWRVNALGVGVLASVAVAVGAFLQPQSFYPAYLVAFLFYWGIATGCLAISLLHHLTGGGWGVAIRRTLEAGCATLPLVGILFVPLLFGMPTLYVWARPDAVTVDPGLIHKAAYLNVEFYELRAAIYFAVWIGLAWWTNSLSTNTAPGAANRNRAWLTAISGVGMVLWTLTVTFASIDWTMSLDPHWISSIHGLIFMAGQAVSALAFAIIVVIQLRQVPEIARVLDEARLHDLGNFLLAFTLFWSYVSFTQYLVIWSGNLPEETGWYLRRQSGGWWIIALLLIGLHFAIPFVLLLSRPIKKSARSLFAIAGLLLGMRLVEYHWQVTPTFVSSAFAINWLMLCTPVALGGLWLAAFIWGLAKRLPIPVSEPELIKEYRDELATPASS